MRNKLLDDNIRDLYRVRLEIDEAKSRLVYLEKLAAEIENCIAELSLEGGPLEDV